MEEVKTLTDYEEQVATQKDAYLGYLAWYTLSGVKITHQAMLNGLTQRALTGVTIPRIPSEVDVFRRSCSTAQSSKVPTALPDVTMNFLVRATDERDPETIRRLIVCETVDKKGKRLSYEECYYIDFKRENSSISWGPLPDAEENVHCATMCKLIVNEFLMWRGCLNSQAIREMLRHALLDFGATKVRDGGGVYFISADKVDTLKALEAFVNEDLGSGSSFHSLPLVDDKKQRDMIKRSFEAETSDAIDLLLTEMQEISASDKQISSSRYAALVTQYQELTSKTKAYAELLETTLGNTDSRLKIFQNTVVNLRAKVKATA